ncbi:MAG: cobalt-precorrin-5B (C(1))-methyltransferase, partial [Bacteroidaceae bacterium]|nr:cobalt-precorrin-5B (C(1))-methyltransferase [Bacteroidaceae bacterium]
QPDEVHFSLPDGEIMVVPVEVNCRGMATVVKDFSDDPDVTRGCRISAKVEWGHDGIRFLRGKGVGRVTLPGLGIPVGGPAINPTPRQMIIQEVRDLTASDVDITLSVEDGEQLAQKTFNPRVGVLDGISIIGTSGIVSPLSNEAFIQSIERELQVARAIGCSQIGFASGRRGEEALHATEPELRVIHYGNFIGASLQMAYEQGFQRAVVGIMIGKAVKLAEGNLDTHSHKVTMNKDFLRQVAGPNDSAKIEGITLARELWEIMPPSFFQRIQELCYQHCRTMFPSGELEIRLICDNPV